MLRADNHRMDGHTSACNRCGQPPALAFNDHQFELGGDPFVGDLPDSDQRGRDRVSDGDNDGVVRVDIGALEHIFSSGGPTTCDGDFDGDGSIGNIDIGVVFGSFGRESATCEQGDSNGDGVVDNIDIGAVFGNFTDR